LAEAVKKTLNTSVVLFNASTLLKGHKICKNLYH